jgi:hypothetical protein
VIFSRLATLGLHKQALAEAGDTAAEATELEISRLLNRVIGLRWLAEKPGHPGRILGRNARHAWRAERAFVKNVRISERAASLPSPRAEALALLEKEGVTLDDLRELQAFYAAAAQ